MNNDERWIEANRQVVGRVPKLGIVFIVFLVLGIIGFYMGSTEGLRAWQAYWVNFLFFAGLAQGGVIIAAIVNVTRGKWGGPMARLGLMNIAFVPISLLLYLGIVFAAGDLIPWAHQPVAGKEWWLDLNFFLIRVGLALAVLAVMSIIFAYFVLRPEAGAIAEKTGNNPYPGWLTRNWRGFEAEKEKSSRILRIFTPVFLFVYTVVYSLVGFDMVMSLDPHWFSTLFGAYYFVTCIYLGIAALIILATLLRKPLGLEAELNQSRFHDIGKLLFAFCILSTDFLWSQFLVIWYGDLPEENYYFIERISEQPWTTLSWIILLCGFVIPFIILLNKKVKTIPITLSFIAFVAIVGIFFERAVTVLRSLYHEAGAQFPIGIVEILISIGFIGLYGASLLWMMRRAPLIPEDTYAAAEH